MCNASTQVRMKMVCVKSGCVECVCVVIYSAPALDATNLAGGFGRYRGSRIMVRR